jgi:hypothetical protein
MGTTIAMGICWSCGRAFGFNPDWVPSIPIDPMSNEPAIGGERRPLCELCVTAANERRVQNGGQPWSIHPEAYAPAEST